MKSILSFLRISISIFPDLLIYFWRSAFLKSSMILLFMVYIYYLVML